jgi:hypothetical protein
MGLKQEAGTYWVKVFIAGPIDVAKQIIRKRVKEIGQCVTIEPTTYIYSGGEEVGYVVGFINYPRSPMSNKDIWNDAYDIANLLKEGTHQDSFTIMAPDRTVWMTDRNHQ